jgi:hypothetical protein
VRRLVGPLFLLLPLAANAPAQNVLPVQPPLHVAVYDMRSKVDGGTPQLVLTLQSEWQYPTLQYRLDATTITTDSAVTVTVNRVINDAGLQQMAIGPAAYTTALDLVPGRYRLTIRADSLVDSYSLRIGARLVELLGDSGRLTIPRRRTFRLPPTALYLHCTPAGFAVELCEAFLKLVTARIGATVDADLARPDHNPFRTPLPSGAVFDSLPQQVFVASSPAQLEELLSRTRAFTDLFRYAQYRVVVVIWRANGPGFTCYDGSCRSHEP